MSGHDTKLPSSSVVGDNNTNNESNNALIQQQNNDSNNNNNIIPEALIAIAKDVRYVNQCKQYIISIIESTLSLRNSNNQYENEAELISWLLYIIFVLAKKDKTAGMEITGIQYDDIPKWKLISGSIISTLFVYSTRKIVQKFDKENDISNNEHLTGQNRRRVFELQRQEMIQRAPNNNKSNNDTNIDNKTNGSASGTTQRSRPSIVTLNNNNNNNSRTNSNYRKGISQWIVSFMKSLVVPTDSQEGPHNIVNSNTNQEQQQRYTIGMWIVRLNLALFCLQGQYPTITDRILSIFFRRQNPLIKKSTNDSTIHNRQNNITTARVVGMLIIAHAIGTFIHTCSRKLIYKWVDYNSQKDNNDDDYNDDDNRIRTRTINTPVSLSSTTTETLLNTDEEGMKKCDICHRVRKYPACSAYCGHVFCWYCLQQWVSNNAPACPLCRKSCSLQHIVSLHDYKG